MMQRPVHALYPEVVRPANGEYNPLCITIPPGVCHGFKCISTKEAIVINTVSEPYNYDNPDEFRIDPHDNDIPYDWARKDG